MRTLRERFLEKVRKTDGCWLWTGALDAYGYGAVWDGRQVLKAHRVAYQLFVGEIPEGMHLLHRCDVTNCVRAEANPETTHLVLGTHEQNMEDKKRKQRGRNDKSPPRGVK